MSVCANEPCTTSTKNVFFSSTKPLTNTKPPCPLPLTQRKYRHQHKLDAPNPNLLWSAMYKYVEENENDIESDDDDDINMYHHHLDHIVHQHNFDLSDDDDDMIIDDDIITNNISSRIAPTGNNTDHSVLLPNPPISNIFMNHPHYNTENTEYQCAMNVLIEQSVDCLSTQIQNPYKIQIPINTVSVPIVDLDDPNKTTTITAAADSGSDIDAIGPKQIARYKGRHKIKTDKNGIVVGTGNGPIYTKQYVPITVINKIGKKYTTKFWCLDTLPNYDFLLGNTTLQRLGWQLVNKYEVWEHKPSNIDHVESELDDLPCSNYPWKGEPKLDLSKVRVEDDELRPFIQQQLEQYREVIAKHEFDSGTFTELPPFEIKLIDEDHLYKSGFHSKEYWTNPTQKEEVLKQLHGLEQHKLIEECIEPTFVSPIFTVPKKTGDVRIVFDYRKLNEITKKLYHPIPNTVELLRQFKGKKYITSLDLKGGYWHVPIKPEDRHKTAFIFDNKIYQWKVMPFGPTNAPMYFQRCMQKIFGDLPYVTIYLDDISVLSETAHEHRQHLREVFNRLKKHGIKLKLDKCLWAVDEAEYLGFIVDKVSTKCNAS